jgi:putative FmdB family regulatory protein
MPQYEYLCKSCEKKFSTVLTLTEHGESKVKCPKCGGTKIEQQWGGILRDDLQKELTPVPLEKRLQRARL